MRAVDEGNHPKATVALGGVNYRSTGLLHAVFQGVTRSGTRHTALLVDRAWMYAEPDADDRAYGFIHERVTVTWRLAYGRRYVRHLDGATAPRARPIGRNKETRPIESTDPSMQDSFYRYPSRLGVVGHGAVNSTEEAITDGHR